MAVEQPVHVNLWVEHEPDARHEAIAHGKHRLVRRFEECGYQAEGDWEDNIKLPNDDNLVSTIKVTKLVKLEDVEAEKAWLKKADPNFYV